MVRTVVGDIAGQLDRKSTGGKAGSAPRIAASFCGDPLILFHKASLGKLLTGFCTLFSQVKLQNRPGKSRDRIGENRCFNMWLL